MTKVLSFVIIAMMVVHLIRPLGLPGLKKRSDFWKIALVALALISLTVVVRPGG